MAGSTMPNRWRSTPASRGRYLRRTYQDESSEVEHSPVDAESSADVEAETWMLAVLWEAFPDHTVDAEESRRHPGDDRYRWTSDPLNGTTPVRIHPVDGDVTPAPSPEAATVMSVVGHDVKRDADARAVSTAIDRGIEAVCKRRLKSWSPTVHWGLLARGRLDGAVCYRPDAEELRLGELFVQADDHETTRGDDGSWFVAARTPGLHGELRAVVDATGTTSSSRR